MKKSVRYAIIVFIAIIAVGYLSIEIHKSSQRSAYIKEQAILAMNLLMNEDVEAAEEILETDCAEYQYSQVLQKLFHAIAYQKEGNIKKSYELISGIYSSAMKDFTEEQRQWISDRQEEIAAEYEEYKKEQERLKKERKQQEEERKLRELKESGVPYVGMSESLIAETSLGKPRAQVRHNYAHVHGKVYMANLYDYVQNGYCIFTARCVNGTVTEVFDKGAGRGVEVKYLDEPVKRKKSSSGYETAEDLYEDHPDDFDSLEDAENYFDDHY